MDMKHLEKRIASGTHLPYQDPLLEGIAATSAGQPIFFSVLRSGGVAQLKNSAYRILKSHQKAERRVTAKFLPWLSHSVNGSQKRDNYK